MRLHPAQNTPVTLDAADLHGRINTGAHAGAYGANDLKTPTDAQAQAGTYKMGRITVQGLRIAIEQPNGSVRTGKDAGGKEWSSRMAAHYGYFEGTRGADGDGIDCFVGPFPESETAFLINQRNKGGGFDEHKVMLGFMSERHARGAYLDSYARGWAGLQSMVPMSIPQLHWWIKHGNKRIALTAESLPLEASKPMTTKKIYWTDTQPDGVSYDQVLYELRRMDGPDGLLLDSVTMAEIMEDTDGVIALDALVVENAQLARMSERLRAIMDRSGGQVKAPAVQVSEPFKARGVTNIATVFELSDGQTVSIFFHNPDTAPNKLAPGDEMISWKWLLNKKDITIVVAPEKGQDLNPRTVAQRIMKLAEKNSPAFQKANAKRAERMGNIEAIRGRIAEKEATLNELVAQVEAAQLVRAQKNADQEVVNAATREQVKKWLEGSGYAVKDAAMGQYTKTINDRVVFVTAAKSLITALVVDSAKLGSAGLNPRSQDFHDALIPTSDGAVQPAMGYAAGFEVITGFVEGREREAVTVVPADPAVPEDDFTEALAYLTEKLGAPTDLGVGIKRYHASGDFGFVQVDFHEERGSFALDYSKSQSGAYGAGSESKTAKTTDEVKAFVDRLMPQSNPMAELPYPPAPEGWTLENSVPGMWVTYTRAGVRGVFYTGEKSPNPGAFMIITPDNKLQASMHPREGGGEGYVTWEDAFKRANEVAAQSTPQLSKKEAQELAAAQEREAVKENAIAIAQQIDEIAKTGLKLPDGIAYTFDIPNQTSWKQGGPGDSISFYLKDEKGAEDENKFSAEARIFLDEPRVILFANHGAQFAGQSRTKLITDDFLKAGDYEDLANQIVQSLNGAVEKHLELSKAVEPAEEPVPELEPTVNPEPAPEPVKTDANAEDRAFFMSLIDGTYPDLDDPELVNNLEAAYQRNSEDAEMVSLFTQAINAYTTASLAETEGM